MSVIVPTVEVEPPPSRFWSTMIAMLSSSIASAPRLWIARQEAADENEVLVQLALRLGRDRVEHDRRLAGARHAGEDRDLAADAQRDVLEIVLAGAAKLDVLGRGLWLPNLALPGRDGAARQAFASDARCDRWRVGPCNFCASHARNAQDGDRMVRLAQGSSRSGVLVVTTCIERNLDAATSLHARGANRTMPSFGGAVE